MTVPSARCALLACFEARQAEHDISIPDAVTLSVRLHSAPRSILARSGRGIEVPAVQA
ncbi:MAG: hypothetical protein H6969_07210 [Gammaproteobacteria bacterium]|nr:hypothetical protein [Gammaproteobacteria bacterium]